MKQYFLLGFWIFVGILGFSQDKITMLTGHELDVIITNQTDSLITYEQTKGSKSKVKTVESFRVFSTIKSGKETIYYKRDTLKGNYLSVEDMRFYIWGAQDAMQAFDTKWYLISGAGAGLIGGFLLSQSFLVVGVPVVTAVASSVYKVKIKDEYVRDISLLEQPAYKAGFQKNAQNSRFFKTLKGSLAGLALGIAAGYAAN